MLAALARRSADVLVIFWLILLFELPAEAQDAGLAAQRQQIEALAKSLRDKEALAAASQLVDAVRERFGENSIQYVEAIETLSQVYFDLTRYADAEPLSRRALELREKLLGPEHDSIPRALNDLAAVYGHQQRIAESIPLVERALALDEKRYGADNPAVNEALGNLANAVYSNMADPDRMAKAVRLYNRAIDNATRSVGPDSPFVAAYLARLGSLYEGNGEEEEAERLYLRAVAIYEKAGQRANAQAMFATLSNLYQIQGRHRESLAILEQHLAEMQKWKAKGADLVLAEALINLASGYSNVGRFDEALAVGERGLSTIEAKLGRDNPLIADYLGTMATIYSALGRHGDAQEVLSRQLALRERASGAETTNIATTLGFLASEYRLTGNTSDAKRSAERAVAIVERLSGGNTSFGMLSQQRQELAKVYAAMGQYDQARSLQAEAVEVFRKNMGETNFWTASSEATLAAIENARGDFKSALAYARAAAAVFAERSETYGAPGSTLKEGRYGRDVYPTLVAAAYGMGGIDKSQREALASEALVAAQREDRTAAAAALTQMAARASAGDAKLADAVRRQQDISARIAAIEKKIVASLSNQNTAPADSERLRKSRAEAERALAAATADLQKNYPDFAALTNPKPIGIEDVRANLKDNEALIAFLVADQESYVWAITKDKLGWERIQLGAEDISARVDALRSAIDLSRFKPDSALFDAVAANELYKLILGPVEPIIKDKPHLLISASGALTALPLHVLVTDKPSATPTKPEDFRDFAFLLKRHAVTTLPSVGSLKALRAIVSTAPGAKPLVGYGDPIFSRDAPASSRGKPKKNNATVEVASVAASGPPRAIPSSARGYSAYFRGANTDVEALSKALAALPETATELKAVAAKLGVSESEIHLGKEASEPAVRKAKLDDYRIVYFATHGLVAGDVNGLAEPALVLTLPSKASEADDGLLTASEVANLKLNADWVVLSACNTAAGDKPGAEALSGLARAFFYAGARALLVSHWPVGSAAAEKLTTATFDALQNDPELGRSEALRRSMLRLMADATDPWNAYPALWAPFVVVGEGGRAE